MIAAIPKALPASTAPATARLRSRPHSDGLRALSMHYATGISWLGATLIAGTERGICAILLGDTPAALLADLRERFPGAEIAPADVAFSARATETIAALGTPTAAARLPLDIVGTPFQRSVWQALQAILPGKTATYAEIAARTGNPHAARAVARACAANHIAVAVPCHRVVRGDGGLAGYRWGLERKRQLLGHEGARATALTA